MPKPSRTACAAATSPKPIRPRSAPVSGAAVAALRGCFLAYTDGTGRSTGLPRQRWGESCVNGVAPSRRAQRLVRVLGQVWDQLEQLQGSPPRQASRPRATSEARTARGHGECAGGSPVRRSHRCDVATALLPLAHRGPTPPGRAPVRLGGHHIHHEGLTGLINRVTALVSYGWSAMSFDANPRLR